MINVTELRPGNYFIDEDSLYQVIDILLNKTAMRKMVAKVKVKNMRTGAITELARNSGYQVEDVHVEKKIMQYSYDAGESLVFMDPNTWEQVELPKSHLSNELQYLTANSEVTIITYEDEILGVGLPAKAVLTVTECEPAIKGDTVNSAMKDAILETGMRIRVPLFINQGDKVSVDTSTGKYDGRA